MQSLSVFRESTVSLGLVSGKLLGLSLRVHEECHPDQEHLANISKHLAQRCRNICVGVRFADCFFFLFFFVSCLF